MLRGIYASASGMLVQSRRLDVVTNNIANAATTGYKPDTVTAAPFAEILLARYDDRDGAGQRAALATVGATGLGASISATTTRLVDGPLRFTGRNLDAALAGNGFFTVETPDGGVAYTRSGAFARDREGYLVTAEGYRVLLEDGQPAGGPGQVRLGDDGTVWVDGSEQGHLAIFAASRDQPLHKVGANLWAEGTSGSELVLAEGDGNGPAWRLRVGYLEGANVEPVLEMAELIETMRAYETNQRAVQIQDQTLGRAVNDVGKIG